MYTNDAIKVSLYNHIITITIKWVSRPKKWNIIEAKLEDREILAYINKRDLKLLSNLKSRGCFLYNVKNTVMKLYELDFVQSHLEENCLVLRTTKIVPKNK